jgi:hypothetical protein
MPERDFQTNFHVSHAHENENRAKKETVDEQ